MKCTESKCKNDSEPSSSASLKSNTGHGFETDKLFIRLIGNLLNHQSIIKDEDVDWTNSFLMPDH